MAAHVFISYSSKDAKVAGTVCEALERRGLKCWISSRNIEPGQNFQQAIVRAIRAARVMVLVFTTNANNSNEIMKEVALAGQYQLMVIPVRVEDVLPNDAFAYEFATRQWIDLFQDWERSIERLAQQIAISQQPEAEGADAAAAPIIAAPPPQASPGARLPPRPSAAVPGPIPIKREKPGSRAWVWAIAASLAILVVLLLIRQANIEPADQEARVEERSHQAVAPTDENEPEETPPAREAQPRPAPTPEPAKPVAITIPPPQEAAPQPVAPQQPAPPPAKPQPPPAKPQPQPDVAQRPPASNGPSTLANIVWQGTYTCGTVVAGGTLTIVQQSGSLLQARFVFYPLNQYSLVKSGSYELQGSVDMAAHRVILEPTRWIYQPFGYIAGGFDGYYDPQNGALNGKVLLPNCGMYSARPISSSN
ncbi:MAG TPA: toll/interleukin-1 receptor domain-containing protein [Stellaceae bacterium]|nr:toll/interleukin-1 receptor domain-containing protein [Stellaceae bacterium]